MLSLLVCTVVIEWWEEPRNEGIPTYLYPASIYEMITVIRWCFMNMRNIVLHSGVAMMSKLRGHSEGTLNVCVACIC